MNSVDKKQVLVAETESHRTGSVRKTLAFDSPKHLVSERMSSFMEASAVTESCI